MSRGWAALPLALAGALGSTAQAGADALSVARAADGARIANVEARIPPQCYTKTEGRSNPCWVCHTGKNGANATDDWTLQREYAFTPLAQDNRWRNLFADRRPAIAAIPDDEALRWLRTDNYGPLLQAAKSWTEFKGYRPDLDFAQGFDEAGFARDGSGWRALRYKPFPGSFWPTNGSVGDVAIRLPPPFRQDAQGRFSAAVYRLNLALLEAAIASPDTRRDGRLGRRVDAVDERLLGVDLDGDGALRVTRRIERLPGAFAGGARAIALRRYEYPEGAEFLHTLHYFDPDAPDGVGRRTKEVRYSRKALVLTELTRQNRWADLEREKALNDRPHISGNALSGLHNRWGWVLQAYIEDADGALRLQTREEQLYCMGCHSGLGVTVDQTFSFARKRPGAAGWGPQSLAGLQDLPQAGSREPEYRRYLRRVGGGDEFRANSEMLARFFPRGGLDSARLARAAPGGPDDLRALIWPGRERALQLAKAYRLVVQEQSFALGRDVVPAPVQKVHRQIREVGTGLAKEGRVYRDGRLWLDWDTPTTQFPVK